jgi:CrcB protein
MTVLWVALGGALGSVARYAFSGVAVRWLGAGFPYGTLFVNVTGSLTIGLLAALVSSGGRPLLGADARAFLLVGVLGGFTTFSSYAYDTVVLARGGALPMALVNALGQVVVGVAFVLLGWYLTR